MKETHPQDTQTRSRLIIGQNGPSDSALAAARGWRLSPAQPLTGTRRAALLGACARACAPRRYTPSAELSLQQAVLAYREEYLVERGFGRLKGKPLSLTPLYLDADERVTGRLRVLLIALRVLCLLEFSVRRQLQSAGEKLAGIYPGNPTRATARPTSELMLRAFEGVTLTAVTLAGEGGAYLTPLSSVQQRILHLLGLSPEIYLRLAQHSLKSLLKMSE